MISQLTSSRSAIETPADGFRAAQALAMIAPGTPKAGEAVAAASAISPEDGGSDLGTGPGASGTRLGPGRGVSPCHLSIPTTQADALELRGDGQPSPSVRGLRGGTNPER